MDAMSPTEPRHARTSRRWLLGTMIGAVVAFIIADAALGGTASFFNLRAQAAAHGWRYPWMLPAIIDAGVPVYVISDHLLVALGHRSWFARLCALAFAAVTVVLNGAAPAGTSLFWRAVFMTAPAAWVLGIECLRILWRRLREPAREDGGRPSLAEYLAAPGRVGGMWRRKMALGVATWTAMRRREDARLLLSDLAAASGAGDAPAVARAITAGWLPGHLAAAVETRPAGEWEPLVTAWAGKQMALPETLAAAITEALPVTFREPSAEPSRKAQASTTRKGSRKPAPAAGTGRGLSVHELADLARKELGEVPPPSIGAIMRAYGVGQPKAKEAQALLTPPRARAAR